MDLGGGDGRLEFGGAIEDGSEFDGGVVSESEIFEERLWGERADFVIDSGLAGSEEGFQFFPVIGSGLAEETESEGLGERGVRSIEHGVASTDIDPGSLGCGKALATSVDERGIGIGFGPFKALGKMLVDAWEHWVYRFRWEKREGSEISRTERNPGGWIA